MTPMLASQYMPQYLPALSKGDSQKKTSALARYFEKNKWDYTWDFDKNTRDYWYEISFEGRILIQVEFHVPVKGFIRDVREQAPDFDGKSLAPVKKALGKQYLYIK